MGAKFPPPPRAPPRLEDIPPNNNTMNTHPINKTGGQYSYPAVPANPVALASAATTATTATTATASIQQRPQQRTGPIIVGAATTSTTVAAAAPAPAPARGTATSSANAPATSNAGNAGGSKFHPVGRCANETLSIIRRAHAAPTAGCGESKRPRVEDCANILDRLVRPLFFRASDDNVRSNNHERHRDDGEIGNETKRRKADGELDGVEKYVDSDRRDVVACKTREEYHSQLEAELKRYKRENLRLVKRRENVFKSIVTLHELYETGLDSIARMNDLRFVPDNVMPDKIPK